MVAPPRAAPPDAGPEPTVRSERSPGRRERRRLAVRGRILDAARALFETRGYQATTVAEVCARADVAYKTFFNHFPSKHAVLLEIEERALEELLGHLAFALALDVPTGERVVRLFERIADAMAAAGPMHRELLSQLIHSVQARGDEPEQVRRVSQAIGEIVRAGLRRGDVRTDRSPETLTELIQGAYYALVIRFGNLEGYPIVERARALGELVAESIVRSDAC